MKKIKFKLLHRFAKVPTKTNPTDAGFDLYCVEDFSLAKGVSCVISLGIASEIPKGHFVSIRDRSSLAAKYGIHTLAGVIDCDYRGEWKVVLFNLGEHDYEIKIGDRIAQGIVHTVPEIEIVKDDVVGDTKRGVDGFGSSGR